MRPGEFLCRVCSFMMGDTYVRKTKYVDWVKCEKCKLEGHKVALHIRAEDDNAGISRGGHKKQ